MSFIFTEQKQNFAEQKQNFKNYEKNKNKQTTEQNRTSQNRKRTSQNRTELHRTEQNFKKYLYVLKFYFFRGEGLETKNQKLNIIEKKFEVRIIFMSSNFWGNLRTLFFTLKKIFGLESIIIRLVKYHIFELSNFFFIIFLKLIKPSTPSPLKK